jgi:hypothetical protein
MECGCSDTIRGGGEIEVLADSLVPVPLCPTQTCADVELKPALRGARQATNRLMQRNGLLLVVTGQCRWLEHNFKKTRSRNRCNHGKAIRITYSECVSIALGIQHAIRMRRIVLPSVACPAVPCFSTLSHKRHEGRKRY